jgi:hypothetical protein
MQNTDRLQTVLGALEAAAIAGVDAVIHAGPDGIDWHAPTFWLGIGLAALRAFKSYYAAGIKYEPPKEGS